MSKDKDTILYRDKEGNVTVNDSSDPIIKCELCGTECYIRGKTTKHYEPVANPTELLLQIKHLEKLIDDHCNARFYNAEMSFLHMQKRIENITKELSEEI